ncbi:DUF1801 domain-containing protein [Microbacterium sp. BK668]|uniref:iron chaperone n=1 Tax=Microbacterium sp. BK668 TaxID=2512118 RepID=UPI00105BF949|nr:DUF1801 domain-containing protein [Microbacterium sp. BK668]TDN91973.1 uncharacterized protein YdhG (YjbR/CyaY superfamily) [Microbacterium sp. BK668]
MGTVDDYLAGLDPADRAVVERVYAVARDEVPDAEQGTGYGMPALVYRGKPLLSVKRTQKHIGLYPFSPDAVSAVADAVRALPETGLDKGTVRFQPSHPLPDDVVRALVLARRQQIDG